MQVPAISAVIQDFLPLGPGVAGTIASTIVFVAAFVLVFVAGRLVAIPIVDRGLEARNLEAHARKPLKKLTNLVLLIAAVAVAFGMAGFENFLQSIATIGAAATLAIGFALQDVLKNFAAGIFIFTDKPFRIGDWIEWDGNAGVVEDISLRVTRVRTFDNELLTVPNSNLTDDVIKNPVAKDQLRLKFLFGIGYDDDIDKATDIIMSEADAHEGILGDPGPSVRLTELGDSSVGLQSRIWIDNPSRADFVKTRAEYVKAVKERFDEEGIDIPYPNRTISGGLEMAALDSAVTAADDD
ncbi:mechanosensitive ion channel family protein [Haloarcula sp. S1CR25-12]|uniref:Mechanosensitive ion channel family protein n=1 Tax=Haloarcula saliterrae TaxID=2950534 RepID=A0ABU2FC45_9EURY|nr:mechanosensitive ion channel family protein [Haloarcula sp. S1CR25-12]MDS0259280.1 mechanosensitive ion channel family protein [Haloarcula sp. S1CR25-12]